jgi:RNA polymerase sigma-70 factor (ECF subfamily)
MAAAISADVGALSAVLAEDAILVTDGGGKRKAALRILVGRDDIIRLFQGLAWRQGGLPVIAMRAARINGYPGLVLTFEDGPETIAFQPGEDGQIAAVYMVRNPEKLAHVAEVEL